jgi:hypothetical protein
MCGFLTDKKNRGEARGIGIVIVDNRNGRGGSVSTLLCFSASGTELEEQRRLESEATGKLA